jgi:hypothetical protein
VLEGDVGEAVSRLKEEDGEAITVNGSATLLRSLFDDAEDRVALELADCHAYDNGVVSLTYQPAER